MELIALSYYPDEFFRSSKRMHAVGRDVRWNDASSVTCGGVGAASLGQHERLGSGQPDFAVRLSGRSY
jgi:hypothetical protein